MFHRQIYKVISLLIAAMNSSLQTHLKLIIRLKTRAPYIDVGKNGVLVLTKSHLSFANIHLKPVSLADYSECHWSIVMPEILEI